MVALITMATPVAIPQWVLRMLPDDQRASAAEVAEEASDHVDGRIAPTGFWILDDGDMQHGHYFDAGLCAALCDLWRQVSTDPHVIDVGCGRGDYVRQFLQAGLCALGIDGNPRTPDYCPSALVHDLAYPLQGVDPSMCVMCLEVAEHLPPQHETALVDNLLSLLAPEGVLVLSWAVPGQGGLGHFNERENAYVVELMVGRGLKHLRGLERLLRRSADIEWFASTIMAFQRPAQFADVQGL